MRRAWRAARETRAPRVMISPMNSKVRGIPPPVSAWAPLRQPVFRMLWIATVVSNVGTWMHEIGAGWLMTTLAPTPVMVALVQAANTLPVFLLALPAGALADIVDRRRYLIVSQAWMMVAALLLGVFTLAGATGAWTLLAFTFALGIGTAMMMPAWGAITPELVSRAELPAAVGLNAMGMNVSRAVGPALAGLIVVAAGPGAVFLLNAVSFVGVIVALVKWRRQVKVSELPAERLMEAMRAGLRYARHSPDLQAVLVRSAAFFLFASAPWALLPLIVKIQLAGGAGAFGLSVACVGAGAVGGAVLLPRLRGRISRDGIVAGASALFAVMTAVLAYTRNPYVAGLALLASGAAWLGTVSSLMTAAQIALPGWVRARGLALIWVVFMGGMALGSAAWGYVAEASGIPMALALSAAGAFAGIAATWRFRVGHHDAVDLAPSMQWPTPMVAAELEHDQGPVMVTVEYRIDPGRAAEFAAVMRHVKRTRQRDGAYFWDLFSDVAEPGRFVETFMVESWLEHLRQHERATVADRDVSARARAFHLGTEPPKVTHLVAGHL